jgi:tryptophan synthase beta chain
METKQIYTAPDEQGYYGKFGGAYIPEMLYRNVEELRIKYLEIIGEASFQKEYQQLLQDYVGRPTPPVFCPAFKPTIWRTHLPEERRPMSYRGA